MNLIWCGTSLTTEHQWRPLQYPKYCQHPCTTIVTSAHGENDLSSYAGEDTVIMVSIKSPLKVWDFDLRCFNWYSSWSHSQALTHAWEWGYRIGWYVHHTHTSVYSITSGGHYHGQSMVCLCRFAPINSLFLLSVCMPTEPTWIAEINCKRREAGRGPGNEARGQQQPTCKLSPCVYQTLPLFYNDSSWCAHNVFRYNCLCCVLNFSMDLWSIQNPYFLGHTPSV